MAKSLLSAFLFTNRNAVETRWFRNEGRTLKSQEICGAVTNNVQRKCLYLTIVAPQTSGFPIQKSPTCMILVFFPNCWDPFPIIPNTKTMVSKLSMVQIFMYQISRLAARAAPLQRRRRPPRRRRQPRRGTAGRRRRGYHRKCLGESEKCGHHH